MSSPDIFGRLVRASGGRATAFGIVSTPRKRLERL